MDIIIKLEEHLRLAMLNSDVDELNKLIADTLVFTLPTGNIINKQFDLETHRCGTIKLTKLEQSEQNIQSYENFAIVTVKAKLEGFYNENPINQKCSYTRVWSKIDDRWKVVAGHVSNII